MAAIDITAMPISEKLKLMEALWDSLDLRTDGDFDSPAWHEQALKEAESGLAAGTARFIEWGDAKEQLRRRGQA